MVTTLFLIRHGATEGSEKRCYKGSIDVPLSVDGIRQMTKASDLLLRMTGSVSCERDTSYLRDVHGSSQGKPERNAHPRGHLLSAIYCSSLVRAVKSAEIIAAPYGLEPVKVDGLRERSFGVWEGMTFLEIKEQYPDEFGLWASNPLRYSPVGGENTLEVKERVIQSLDRIVHAHPGEHIGVIAHGGVNRIILCHILGIPLENIFRVEQDHAAINIIEFWDKYPVVKLVNGRSVYESEE